MKNQQNNRTAWPDYLVFILLIIGTTTIFIDHRAMPFGVALGLILFTSTALTLAIAEMRRG